MNGKGGAFGQLVRKHRQLKKISVEHLALKVFGKAEESRRILALENGDIADPSPGMVKALAAFLAIPAAELEACRSGRMTGQSGGRLQSIVAAGFAKLRPDAGPAETKAFIAQKTKEASTIRAGLASLSIDPERKKMLSVAVAGFIAEGDLRSAEAQLDRATRLRINESSKAAILREQAAVALLGCAAPRAAEMFEQAASVFDELNPDFAVEIRGAAGNLLHTHAIMLRRDWSLAAPFFRKAAEKIDKTKNAEEWAMAQNNLAVSIHQHAMRVPRNVAIRLLGEAARGYEAALTVYSQKVRPARWAAAQHNLAETLMNRAALVGGMASAQDLDDAIAALASIFDVRLKGADPHLWAKTQYDLATALTRRAEVAADDETAAEMLGRALTASRACGTIYDPEKTPEHYMAAQNRFAMGLRLSAALTDGGEAFPMLNEAVEVLQSTLGYAEKLGAKAVGLSLRRNLATALIELAQLLDRAASRDAYREAGRAARAAIEAAGKDTKKRGEIQAIYARALCGEAIATGGAGGAPLSEQALTQARASLDVEDRERGAMRWADARNIVGVALEVRAEFVEEEERSKLLAEAKRAFEESLEVALPFGKAAALRSFRRNRIRAASKGARKAA